jgi:hypothetical protein
MLPQLMQKPENAAYACENAVEPIQDFLWNRRHSGGIVVESFGDEFVRDRRASIKGYIQPPSRLVECAFIVVVS